jgi:hypothetical protein
MNKKERSFNGYHVTQLCGENIHSKNQFEEFKEYISCGFFLSLFAL